VSVKVGDLVQMKGPSSKYAWRRGAGKGVGVIIEAAHQTETTMRGITVFWSSEQGVKDIPEDWVETV
jgi:hypothetical protein